MQHRDLLKDQIEQLGKVISGILADFIGMKTRGETSQGILNLSQQFKEKLDLELDNLVSFSQIELIDYVESRQLFPNQLEIIADCLKEMGSANLDVKETLARTQLERALVLLDYVDEKTKTLSLDRNDKKKEIERILKAIC
jgi:hypothetical protein